MGNSQKLIRMAAMQVLSGNLPGNTSGAAPAAGVVGEKLETLVAAGAPVALSTNTAANVATLSLTPGVWDVSGNVSFAGAGGLTQTAASACIGSGSATMVVDGSEVPSGVLTVATNETDGITIPPKRFLITATANVYLVAKATFAAGSIGTYGKITAIRR